ncbi:MAG: FtsH protease activity modulator HflK [Desulfocapsaceae bacterium]|nr:FtsH protease activity modulator HflK [Desulfocapsaceae bacterium]
MPNQNQEPPWGRRRKPQTPEEFIAQLIQKVQNFFSEQKAAGSSDNEDRRASSSGGPLASLGRILFIIFAIIIVLGMYSSVHKIAPNEVGVVLQLGKFSRTVNPGLRITIPYAEQLYKVEVEDVKKEEFGFRSKSPGQVSSFDRQGFEKESLMLTADKNVINVAWIVQYKIKDPKNYLFMVKNVRQAIRDISESVTRRIVGNMDFDYVLSNRDLLAASVKGEMQTQIDSLHAGVAIGTVQFQDINPPDPVKPAFNEVNEADQDMKRLVNEAEETYNKEIPKARGDAKKIVEEAQGYAAARINTSQGETERFLAILKEYKNAPDVTRKRMYLETMQSVMPTVQSVYVMDKNQQNPLPLLNITGAKDSISAELK